MPERPRRVLSARELGAQPSAVPSRSVADSTSGAAPSKGRSNVEASAFLEKGAELQNGRFVIRQALGIGGMGVVYEADDRLLESTVALKTLLGADTERLLNLKREFRSLEGLSHPNLVKLGELFEDEHLWFFTMERVYGAAFTRYVRPDGLHVDRFVSSLVQLTHGLMALHDAGKVHRDIKPSNTLVEAGGRVVLLDFGLLIDAPFAEADAVGGTAEYMAPEQLSGQVSAAADWYALGVMLYESMTGRLPFTGAARPSERTGKLEPPPQMALGTAVPPELERLCLDLLKPEPGKRPSGAEVLRRLLAVRGPGAAPPSPGTSEVPRFSSSPVPARFTARPQSRKLVGRRNELERMEALFSSACEVGSTALFVLGEPGVGKSALLSEFTEAVRGRALVLSSRCHENEFLAHKALDGIVDGVFREFDRGPLSLLEGLPGADRSALVQVFPVLRPLFQYGVPDDPGSDPFQTVHSARRAAFRGLRTLLSRLSRRTPLVLIIDDLQWADADSLLALESLMTDELPRRILLMMAARNGTEAPRLEIPLRRLELGALDIESATKLAHSLLEGREANPIGAAALAEEARGLPLFVEMLAHYSRILDATPFVELDSLLRARLDALVDSQRRVLELLSVAASPVGQRQLSAASGVKLANLVIEVRDLRIGHWVVTRQSEGDTTVEPYHDSVRRAVLASMSIERRRETHHHWAVAIERAPEGIDPEVLARHWVSADNPERAVDYVIEAARRAERALAFDRAAKLYGWALELGAERDTKHAELTHRHAESLSNAGRARDAATAYLRASDLASAGERWGFHLRAAEQLLRAGYVDEGLKTVDRLVRSLGMTLPSHPIDGILRLLGERLLGTKVLSRLASQSGEPSDELTRKADVCYAVALGLAQVDPFASAAFTARYMRYAHALRDDRRIALGLCLRAPQAAAAGLPATGAHRLLSRVRAVVDEASGKSRLEAHLALAEAGVAFLLGDFAATLGNGRKALSMFARLPGSTWEIGTVQRYVLTSLWHTGQLQELERHTKQLLEDADDRKDRYTANQLRTTVVPIVHLKNDDPERALAELTRADRDLPPPRTSLQRWQHRQHEALVALYLGKPFEVLALMKQQKAGAGRLILRRVAAMRIATSFHRATAILAAMASNEHLEIRGWSTMLRRDIRSIRRATLEHIPCFLEAQLAYWNRDHRKARALLERAERLFVESGMALFAAVCAWGLGTVDTRHRAHRERAEGWMKEQGIKNPRKFVRLMAPLFAD